MLVQFAPNETFPPMDFQLVCGDLATVVRGDGGPVDTELLARGFLWICHVKLFLRTGRQGL